MYRAMHKNLVGATLIGAHLLTPDDTLCSLNTGVKSMGTPGAGAPMKFLTRWNAHNI